MKKFIFTFCCVIALLTIPSLQAQQTPALDQSPVDIAYYPPGIAFNTDASKIPLIKVIYGRPQKKDREIFGKLVPYGEVWRTGANESTEIKFYQDVKINGKDIKAGTYSLFTIPNKDKWIIILNSDLDKWGAYFYDQSKDIARFDVEPGENSKAVEAFTIGFKETGKNTTMTLAWDTTMIELPIQL